MKAYEVWSVSNEDGVKTVVFAENAQAAKNLAYRTVACEEASYTDIRVRRFPEMDAHHRGRSEMDWYAPEDRAALVACGWACVDISPECDTCAEKGCCPRWEEV